MLTEEKTQFGGMSLDVAHVVEMQLQKADRLSLRPGILDRSARLLVRQRLDGRAAFLAHRREIGAQLVLGIGTVGRRLGGIEHPLSEGGGGANSSSGAPER